MGPPSVYAYLVMPKRDSVNGASAPRAAPAPRTALCGRRIYLCWTMRGTSWTPAVRAAVLRPEVARTVSSDAGDAARADDDP